MWATADQNQLRWYLQHQNKLRASLYSGLEDAMTANDGEVDLHQLGQQIILPSSYIASARHMQQRFQDAMAIARHFQKIDLFITITANPNWPEIQRELLPMQSVVDRPDLVTRVFQLKRKAILKDVIENKLFGPIAAYVYTVEFQKRGLPHQHNLFFLKRPYKLLTPNSIDEVIWARWPDPLTQPLLFEAVKKFMVHGPCGEYNANAPCMENNRCIKGFPKPFQAYTAMDREGYPLYFHPNDHRVFEVRGHLLDNRWIVPYNPYTIVTYQCHINTECAVSFASVKYSVKYMHKGGDRASFSVETKDEIKHHIDGRYFSASEATWRILHFKLHEQMPNVVRLQIHLPGQHLTTFDPMEDPMSVVNRAAQEDTSLTAYFKANADEGDLGIQARRYTYQEFPQHFTLHSSTHRLFWSIRKRGWALGRPTSWEHLRTFHGIVHPTFREACLARGLLQDDGEWRACLSEAATMQTGSRLRHLFITILLFCAPTNPHLLWNEFHTYICDDLPHRLQQLHFFTPSDDDVNDYSLFLLNDLLSESQHTLADFPPMPLSNINWHTIIPNPYVIEQLDYDPTQQQALAASYIQSLNNEQRAAFSTIMYSVEHHNERNVFFLHGVGGTGKTYIYKTLTCAVRAKGWIVLCVTATGLAALLLTGGRTGHSTFKIPIVGLMETSSCAIPKESSHAALLRMTKLIIYDESLMQHKHAFEAIDRSLQDICDNSLPFGGITIVFGGDFQQILPVIINGSREDIVSACLQRSYLWRSMHVIQLHHNMRLQNSSDDNNFNNWLLEVGHGRNLTSTHTTLLPPTIISPSYQHWVNTIYSDLSLIQSIDSSAYFLERALLAPRNADVISTNTDLLNHMHGDVISCYSADSIVCEPGNDVPDSLPIEYL